MDLTITLKKRAEFDVSLALSVRRHVGAVWIYGLKKLSAADAEIIADHSGELHLPDVVHLPDRAAVHLARHVGELHLDSLREISDEGLQTLMRQEDLWVPASINKRIKQLWAMEGTETLDDEDQDSDESEIDEDQDEEQANDEGENAADEPDPYAPDYSQPVDEWEEDDDEQDEDSDGEIGEPADVRSKPHHDQETPLPAQRSTKMDALLRPLDQLVGLQDVKRSVRSVVSLARVAQQRRRSGLSVAAASYHMAFFGPPGTGKTTVARLVASILREAGVLARGHLVETDGQGLVAKYLGQTGHRVKEIVERSLGGVLFIDEAYSLIPRDGSAGAYASEAIATLVPLLETYREDLVVILAGYEEEMNELFASNPGLRSRVAHHLVFPPMEMDQLQKVYEQLAGEHGYLMSTPFKAGVRYAIDRERRIRGKRFANARAVRTLFEATLRKQAERLAAVASPSVIQLQTLLIEDLPEQIT